jgi:hypothetical protein
MTIFKRNYLNKEKMFVHFKCGILKERWHHFFTHGPLTGLLYQPRMIDDDDDDCGAIGVMRVSRGNRSTQKKPDPVPRCPPQVPHDLTRARTRAAAVGSRRRTGSVMAWPLISLRKLAEGAILGSNLGPDTDYPDWDLLWFPQSLNRTTTASFHIASSSLLAINLSFEAVWTVLTGSIVKYV